MIWRKIFVKVWNDTRLFWNFDVLISISRKKLPIKKVVKHHYLILNFSAKSYVPLYVWRHLAARTSTSLQNTESISQLDIVLPCIFPYSINSTRYLWLWLFHTDKLHTHSANCFLPGKRLMSSSSSLDIFSDIIF